MIPAHTPEMRTTWRAKRAGERFVSYSDLDSPSVNSAAFNPSRMLSRPRSPAIARLLYRLCASIVRLHADGVRKDRFNRWLQRMLRHVRIGRRITTHPVCGRPALAAQHTCDSCQHIGKAEVLPPVTKGLRAVIGCIFVEVLLRHRLDLFKGFTQRERQFDLKPPPRPQFFPASPSVA